MKNITLRHTQLTRILKVMLALLISFSYCSGLQAQSVTYTNNDEYGKLNMSQYKVADNDQYSTNDPFINLSMDCLAANGYGQWTVTSNTGNFDFNSHTPKWLFSPNQTEVNTGQTWNPQNSSGWFLLGNLIGKPSERSGITDGAGAHPGCQPPGIVSGGTFNTTFPASPKVTANLVGSVRYVWVEPTNRNSFLIEGFNDERGTNTTPLSDRQIDITLKNFPNPPINRQIIQKPIFTYTDASTNDGTLNHPVIASTGTPSEADFRDQFDIACDQNYLYIVWCSPNATSPHHLEIWVTAVDIHSGSVYSTTPAFPYQVASSSSQDFIRPTIACNVRNAPSSPVFTLSYIAMSGGNGTVVVKSFSGTTVTYSKTYGGTSKKFHDPTSTTISDHSYATALHARILKGSVEGSTTSIPCLYVNTGDEMICYYNSASVANYVDGILAYNSASPYPFPINTASTFNNIVDKYIVAFTDPYDKDGTYNQFHCLYQLSVTTPLSTIQNPLIIIKGNNNGFANPGTSDTRILLNQDGAGVIDDPSQYVAAVNQMGIHVHWRTPSSATLNPSTHFYVRDTRAFDEDIEEHTLVTNESIIGASSKLLDGVRFTLWTDPNYGASESNANSGLIFETPTYLSDPTPPSLNSTKNIGQIFFNSDNYILSVGDNSGYNVAFFYMVSNCLVSSPGSAATIKVSPNSVWEHYGGICSVKADLEGEDAPAYLNIHGGCIFGLCPSFRALTGEINILWEPHVAPIHTSSSTFFTTNSSQSGLFQSDFTSSIQYSHVYSHIPTGFARKIIKILGSGTGSSTNEVFSSTGNYYANLGSTTGTVGGGVATIQYNEYGSGGISPDHVTFDGDEIDHINFHFIDPQGAGLTFQNMYLDHNISTELQIERSTSFSNSYGNIILSNNTFARFGMSHFVFGDCGIYLRNFNETGLEEKITVDHNTFTTANTTATAEAAIKLENVTGNITNNHVTDPAYMSGIEITNSLIGSTFPTSYSYLCNNRVENLVGDPLISILGPGAGLLTLGGYQGYVKSCQFLSNGIGISINGGSSGNDIPGIVFSRIQNNVSFGLQLSSMGVISKADLSGVHGSTSSGDDYAAFDTISGNGGTQINLLNDGSSISNSRVELGNSSQAWTWGSFGENNIFDASPNFLRILAVDPTFSTNGTVDLRNIDNNFWGTSVDPSVGTTGSSLLGFWAGGTTDIYSLNVSYTSNHSNTRNSHTATGFDVTCSGGFASMHSKVAHPLSVIQQQEIDSCSLLYNKAYNYGRNKMYQIEYDTARIFIEHCANIYGSPQDAFVFTHEGIQNSNIKDTTRYRKYREWLISVLFLNKTNPQYFCSAMFEIAQSYAYSENIKFPNALNSIVRWMKAHGYCPNRKWSQIDSAALATNHYYWSMGDTTKPFDSSMNTMHELGLDFLDSLTAGIESPKSLSAIYLSSLSVTPNPSHGLATAKYDLKRQGFVQFTLYDVLGRVIWSRAGESESEGIHELPINLQNKPPGTYYLRVESGFGEVQTVKLVHE